MTLKRFGTVKARHPVEHLSENGSPYTAKQKRDFAAPPKLAPCFTPMKRPETNGMAEAFVKTLKRDYVRIAGRQRRSLDGSMTATRSIYTQRSPREFIRAQAQ